MCKVFFVDMDMLTLRDRHGSALCVRITLVARIARAHRIVIDNTTLCIQATRSRTRIDAMLIRANQVTGTIVVVRTLWPAIRRTTNVVGQTAAGRLTTDVTTL